MAKGRKKGALNKAPKKGCNVEQSIKMFKAGWEPTTQEFRDEFFPGASSHRAGPKAASLIKWVREWLRRGGENLAFFDGKYAITTRKNCGRAINETIRRVAAKIFNPQRMLVDEMGKYEDDPRLSLELQASEFLYLESVHAYMEIRRESLRKKMNNEIKKIEDEN